MQTPEQAATAVWPLWQRVLFRFFFVYLLLQIAPWNWFYRIPGIGALNGYVFNATNWLVQQANARVFHVREKLVMVNGSGDTSWAWTQLWLYLSLAAIACVIWSVLDRKRPNYSPVDYWLRTFVRYYVATAALSYGIIKIFAMQMVFPTTSQLSTPLGDLLPMRFSWLFIGYSTPYQVFSGVMETVAGLLLLNRRTVTLGLFAATGAFLNVVMINLAYDVPVKLYAIHLLFSCFYLLAWDAKRLFTFLALNEPASSTHLYDPPFTKPWQNWGHIALKAWMVIFLFLVPLNNSWKQSKTITNPPKAVPFAVGVYDVRHYVLNGDTIPPLVTDTLRWRDVIFDNGVQGSIHTSDSLFWQRYRRGYFRYKADTARKTVVVWKTNTAFDSTYLFDMRYEIPDSNTVRLWAGIRSDSVYVELVKSKRHFQLAERQFHWLSEYNR